MCMRSENSTRTASSSLVVPVDKIRRQLGFGSTERDPDLVDMIHAATKEIEENWLWQSLLNATCVDKFETLGEMALAWNPVQSITSITYVDQTSTTQTLSSSIYELGSEYGVGIVRLKYDQAWPTCRDHDDDVVVTYVAGYGTTPETVPVRIRQAIELKVRQLFRPGESSENEDAAIRRLLSGLGVGRML